MIYEKFSIKEDDLQNALDVTFKDDAELKKY